jgi:hypothetical protein
MQKIAIANKEIGTKKIDANTLPTEGTQLIYSEHLIGMAIGPFVSKIVVGMDNSPNIPVPQYTLVMPTNALHQMAKHIMDSMSAQEAQKKIGDAFKNYQESVES